MARPIKETPILKGKDAERFVWHIENPTPVSEAEVLRAKRTYERFKSISNFEA